jgi:hypothetical protein
MMTNLLLLLGLTATCSAVAVSYFRTDRELEPFQEHLVKQPVLGSGRNQDCKWTKEGDIINQQKFTGDYVNMGLEKVLDGTWQCVLRIVRVTEEADNGKMFSLEFKDQVYQVTTYVDAEKLAAVVEERPPSRLDEMTQSMLNIVYIAMGVFVAGSVIFYGLLKCT